MTDRPLVDQPTAAPTNKATVASIVASLVSPTVLILGYHLKGEIVPPEILEAYGNFVVGLIGLGSVLAGVVLAIAPRIGLAWWVRDRANVDVR